MASSKSRIPTSPSARVALATRRSTNPRIATRVGGPLVFGVVVASGADELGKKIEKLLRWTGKRAGLELELHNAETYEALAKDIRKARVDIAWLPPIVHVRLAEEVVALGNVLRDGRATYESALIVHKSSAFKTIASLRGARAGWVDRWSAAGFVLPRVNLALHGIDARNFFRAETFHGSHRGVVNALVDGACDVGGTYAQADSKGKVKGGAWSEVDGAEVRVIATFGAIPPDVIASRAALDEARRSAVQRALLDASITDEGKRLMRDVFGGDTFVEDIAKSYQSLASALQMASARGLFE